MPYRDPDARRAAARERQRRRRAQLGDQAAAIRRDQRQRQRQADPDFAARERAELDERATRGKLTGAGARTFVAIDGESTSEADHRYVMLCSSTGDTLMRREGIGTVEGLLWLIGLKRRPELRRATFVAFGLNYDVNMLLRDVPHGVLRRLWRDHEADWYVADLGVYVRFAWIPSKRLWVGIAGVGTIELSEVFGFFQQSFLRALEDWQIPDVDGAIARIRRGKADRSGFRWRDRRRVERYCLAECALLVELMGELRRALERAQLVPRRWQGAGSVAAALLGREPSIAEHHRHDDRLPPKVLEAVMHAYYGGRFEVFQQGELAAGVQYDIRSAYPSHARRLPSLVGSWQAERDYDPAATWALWRCTWHTPASRCPVMPFPYRHKRAIYFPERGAGWYWADEVRAARELWGDRVQVHNGWRFRPDDPAAQPFAFIDRIWELRAMAKAAGAPEQKAYKLALNSLYGKLAQGVGWRGSVPRFRSFSWAGQITSGTRAQLLRMVAGDPDAVIATATDGVLYSRDPGLPEGDDLGELERAEVDDLFVAMSGVYVSSAGERRRGWQRSEIDWTAVLDGWRSDGPLYQHRSTARRFVGLGSALGRNDCWDVWRTWADMPRMLSLWPSRKGPAWTPFLDPMPGAGTMLRWDPPEGWPRRLSDVYVPKTGSADERERDGSIDYINDVEQPDLAAVFGEQ